jgi:hypothetical protein
MIGLNSDSSSGRMCAARNGVTEDEFAALPPGNFMRPNNVEE